MNKISRRKFLQGTAIIGTSSLLLGNINFTKYSIKNDFDLIIKNGTIIDGLGSKSFKADLGIISDRILEIGDLKNASAAKIIDAN